MGTTFIPRQMGQTFERKMRPGKVMLIYGPRRTGKTSFLRNWVKAQNQPFLWMNGEDMNVERALSERTVENYQRIIGSNQIVVIDEAQQIGEIGLILKLMVDEFPYLRIIATGSSSFDLNSKAGDPLTGRYLKFEMYPIAQQEYAAVEDQITLRARLDNRLVYGTYPELEQYSSNEERKEYLSNLVNSYLLKDILEYEGIRNSQKIYDLLRLIAFQVGNEVSHEELGRQLRMSKNTVERYLELLTKSFVLFKLTGFSRNLRKEINKSTKWYFVDNGVRNAFAANFNSLDLRNDGGSLWENFILSERRKYLANSGTIAHYYFWRTYDQQEIDWIEERDGSLFAFETKLNIKKKLKVPVAFEKAYPGHEFSAVDRGNYQKFVGIG